MPRVSTPSSFGDGPHGESFSRIVFVQQVLGTTLAAVFLPGLSALPGVRRRVCVVAEYDRPE
jgi:hypothetical protein